MYGVAINYRVQYMPLHTRVKVPALNDMQRQAPTAHTLHTHYTLHTLHTHQGDQTPNLCRFSYIALQRVLYIQYK